MSEGRPQLSTPKKVAFLAAYAKCGVIRRAAKAAKIDRGSHYEWMKDPEYQALFREAHQEACEVLETEARRRATTGWDEPVFHEGVICGHKRKFSDTLLIFLMKGAMPEKYRDMVEHSGKLDVEHKGSVRIKTDADWYDNDAHDRVAQSSASPVARPALTGPVQGSGLRKAVGQNGNRTHERH